jgi:hypothetical protein
MLIGSGKYATTLFATSAIDLNINNGSSRFSDNVRCFQKTWANAFSKTSFTNIQLTEKIAGDGIEPLADSDIMLII